MRTLNDREMNEFYLTFEFLDLYIGCAANRGAETINDIKFDGLVANTEILKFVKNNFNNDLKKVNLMFNAYTTEHKRNMIQRLIKYCFQNKVQPHRLRMMGFKNYEIVKSEAPVVYEYEGAA